MGSFHLQLAFGCVLTANRCRLASSSLGRNGRGPLATGVNQVMTAQAASRAVDFDQWPSAEGAPPQTVSQFFQRIINGLVRCHEHIPTPVAAAA